MVKEVVHIIVVKDDGAGEGGGGCRSSGIHWMVSVLIIAAIVTAQVPT